MDNMLKYYNENVRDHKSTCKICHKQFTNFKVHMKEIHEKYDNLNFNCKLCYKCYTGKGDSKRQKYLINITKYRRFVFKV